MLQSEGRSTTLQSEGRSTTDPVRRPPRVSASARHLLHASNSSNSHLGHTQALMDCWTNIAGAWVEASGDVPGTGLDAWTWVPAAGCAVQLPPLTHAKWCDAHDGSKLLFVGDSLSTEQYRATLAFFAAADDVGSATAAAGICSPGPVPVECDQQRLSCQAECVCGGRALVAFIRNDLLALEVTHRERFTLQWGGVSVLHPLGGRGGGGRINNRYR